MSSSGRHLRWSILALVCALGLLGGVAWWLRTRGPAVPAQGEGTSVEPMTKEEEEAEEVRFVGDVVRLEPGKPVERELNGREGHRFELSLEAGQFAHLVVEQKGIDVAVGLRRPDGSGGEVDSPNWRLGREVVYTMAKEAGVYRVDVESTEPAGPPGRYEIRLDELRTAMPEDEARLDAWRVFRRGESLRKEGKFGDALAAYREALPLWSTLGDPEWSAETQYRIGWMLWETGRSAEAVEMLRAAQVVLRGPGRLVEEIMILNLIGSCLGRQGEVAEARRLLQEDLSRARDLKIYPVIAGILNNLGNAQLDAGEVEVALESFRESLALARQEGVPWEEAFALQGQATALLFLGRPEQALTDFRQALAILERIDGSPSGRAEVLRLMADALKRLERLDEAGRLLDQALALNRESGDAEREVNILNSLGTVHLLTGHQEKARAAYEQALEVSRDTGNRLGEAYSRLNLGRYYYEVNDAARALDCHEAAEKIFQEIGDRRGEVSNSFGMARALHRLGRDEESLALLGHIPLNVEALRKESESPDSRSSYLATKQHYYDLYVDVLMHLHEQQSGAGHDIAALEIHERRRARSFLDLLNEARVQIRRGVDPALLAREKDLLERLNRQQGPSLAEPEPGLLRELETVRADIRKKSPRYAALTQPRPLRFAGMQALLPADGTLLLIYSLGEEHSYLWCVGKNGRVSRRLPARSWIEDKASQVVAGWSRPGRPSREERWEGSLSEALLKPVADRLGSRRLVIVADGALQGLPFGALPDPNFPDEPLLARHEIVYLPSASVLAVLRKELHDRWPARGDLAVIADPVFAPDDPRLGEAAGQQGVPRIPTEVGGDLGRALRDVGASGLERLPYTDEEVKRIGRYFAADRSKVLLGFEANRESILSGDLKNYRRLHFATHGVLNSKDPALSGLVLSLWEPQGKPRDGFLLAQEIYNLELPAELVVLSACQTGIGKEVRGEGVIGLTRSFMYAGAPRIVVSLWKVSDRATAELMDRFYRAMMDHRLTPAQALRCAQLSMLRGRYADPFLWAGFIFQGEWSREIPEPPKGISIFLDDSIETPVAGRGGSYPDDDLPPPSDGEDSPPVCPDLGDERPRKTP